MGKAGDFVANVPRSHGQSLPGDIDPGDTGDKSKAGKDLREAGAPALGPQENLRQNQGGAIRSPGDGSRRQDGAIKPDVRRNPRAAGYSFKKPSPEELDHDSCGTRCGRLPERGRIGILTVLLREVLVVSVNRDS